MLVKQCHRPPIKIYGWNPIHKNGKLGMVNPIALLLGGSSHES